MNTLELNKKEIGYLFIITAIFPVMSLTLGFHLSDPPYSYNTIEQKKPVTTNTETSEVKIQEIYASPSSAIERNVELTQKTHTFEDTQVVEIEVMLPRIQYDIQAGVFSNISNAIQYQNRLIIKDIDAQIIAVPVSNDLFSYRVVLGTFESKTEALQYISLNKQFQKIEVYIKEIDNTALPKVASL